MTNSPVGATMSAHLRHQSHGCQEHINWAKQVWGRVLFTDEIRFSLVSDSWRTHIWREQKRRNTSNILKRDSFGCARALILGNMMLDNRTILTSSKEVQSLMSAILSRIFCIAYVCLDVQWVWTFSSWTTTLHRLITQWLSQRSWRLKILSA